MRQLSHWHKTARNANFLAVDWLPPASAFLIGILSGFLSVVAGAAVTVVIPVLIGLGLSADAANATSRFSIAVGGSVAVAAFIWKGRIDWKASAPLLGAAAAGTLLGAVFGARISSPHMLTIIVATSAISMILVYLNPHRWIAETPAKALFPEWSAILLFFLLCIYEGIVAVDSALLRLIALVYLFGYPLAVANPVKLLTSLVMFGVSSAVYARAGEVDWSVGGWLAAGTVLGAVLAIPFACSHKAQRPIYRLLQIVVTAETLWLIVHWWRVGR